MSAEIDVIVNGSEPLTEAEAKKLTAEIVRSAEVVWTLVSLAYSRRAWTALGYDSWNDYCMNEFESCRLGLPREQRAGVVASLRESGLSVRAISAVTGSSVGTVHAEIASRVQNRTPEPQSDLPPGAPTESTPGMTDRVQSALDRARRRESEIVGTDGKSYSASKSPSKSPSNPRPRRPLPDAWSAAVRDLDKAVQKLDRLTADDRFGRNRANLHGKHDMIRARNLLYKLISVLDGDPTLPGVAK